MKYQGENFILHFLCKLKGGGVVQSIL